MNKRLFVLICSIILFQYIYSGTVCDTTFEEGVTPTQELCNGRDGSESEICVLNTGGTGCELKAKGSVPCAEVKAGEGDSNALCLSLKTNVNKLCLKKSGGGCEEKAKEEITCTTITSGASDAICKGLQVASDSLCVRVDNACQPKKKCNNGEGNDDTACNAFPVEKAGNVCKSDPDAKGKCKEVKKESATSSSYSLKFSLALLIFLFLF
jgi:hypothetical protein